MPSRRASATGRGRRAPAEPAAQASAVPALAPLVLYGLTHRVPAVAEPLALFVLRRSLVTSQVWLFLIAAPAVFLCCYHLAYADLIAGVVSQLITVPISCTR